MCPNFRHAAQALCGHPADAGGVLHSGAEDGTPGLAGHPGAEDGTPGHGVDVHEARTHPMARTDAYSTSHSTLCTVDTVVVTRNAKNL